MSTSNKTKCRQILICNTDHLSLVCYSSRFAILLILIEVYTSDRVLDTFHTACVSHAFYTVVVLDYGNFVEAIKLVWSMSVSKECLYAKERLIIPKGGNAL